MALGDERRAIGRRNESERRAIGTNNEAERRAIGRDNEAERRGTEVVDEINRLVKPATTRPTLRPVQPIGAVPAKRGTGTYKAPASNATGGGIASPLTEKTRVEGSATVPDRTYYVGGYRSSDGLFILPAIQTQNMTDASGADVVFEFADPQGTV